MLEQSNVGVLELSGCPLRPILCRDAASRVAARSTSVLGCISHIARGCGSHNFCCNDLPGCSSQRRCGRSLLFDFLLMLVEPTRLGEVSALWKQLLCHCFDEGVVPAIAAYAGDAQSRTLHQRRRLGSNFRAVQIFQLPDPIFAWRFCTAQTTATDKHSLHMPATHRKSLALLDVCCHGYLVTSGNSPDQLYKSPTEDTFPAPRKSTDLESAWGPSAVAATAFPPNPPNSGSPEVFQILSEHAPLPKEGNDVVCQLGDATCSNAGT